ncbi:MAG TPA: DUF5675 family protein [Candidatus Dormibacteraeota bacterium]|nr:DUF5675 family protein [Candidatus Dormibacteraeota bacterium]
MRLELVRDRQTRQGTTGHLFLGASGVRVPDKRVPGGLAAENSMDTPNANAPFCVTLERPAVRFGDPHPCIPAGEYRVVLYESPHFGRTMPLLADVPGRSGIEIHWGNFVRDFEGCIGVGAWRGQMPDGSPTIWSSRETFDRLFCAIEPALLLALESEAEACVINIRDPQPPVPLADVSFTREAAPEGA